MEYPAFTREVIIRYTKLMRSNETETSHHIKEKGSSQMLGNLDGILSEGLVTLVNFYSCGWLARWKIT